jgi:hypothetical protein
MVFKLICCFSVDLRVALRMGGGNSKPNPPASRPVPPGKIRICVVGYKISHNTGKAHELAGMIARKMPQMCAPFLFPLFSFR